MTPTQCLSIAGAFIMAMAAVAQADSQPSLPSALNRPTIVLVHGAFADATGWQRVIPILERDGYPVIAVQIPLASLSGDVETTKRVIDAQNGPVVAVGHSSRGAVITGAAAGNPNVRALVYLAAFAPEANEPLGAFGKQYPAPLISALKPDAAGFLYIDRRTISRRLRKGRAGHGRKRHGGYAKAAASKRVRRGGNSGGVENDSVLVPGLARGSRNQSRP